MTIKATGYELKQFMADEQFWAGGAWYDDADITVDGEEQDGGVDLDAVADAADVRITGGYVAWEELDKDPVSLEGFFKKWKKLQTEVVMIVRCDCSVLDAVKDAIKAAGGKVS